MTIGSSMINYMASRQKHTRNADTYYRVYALIIVYFRLFEILIHVLVRSLPSYKTMLIYHFLHKEKPVQIRNITVVFNSYDVVELFCLPFIKKNPN